MRIVSVVACVAFVAGAGFAGTGSALAADCNKGMLWPFVRTAGDCLTDVEIASGKTGVYSGPVNTNVDVSAIKPSATPVQNSGSSGSGIFGTSIFSGGSGGNNNGGELITTTSIFGAQPPDRPAGIACNKGTLWPFQREPGDCLTEAEKKEGKTGVYGGGPGLIQASATPGDVPNATQAPTAPSCQRSWLWPFVREAGDCPTAAEKGTGVTPASAQMSAVTPAAPVPAAAPNNGAGAPAPAPNRAPAAASCQRGLLWPFVRESGDCPTDTDKKAGVTPTMAQMSAATPAPPTLTAAESNGTGAPAPASASAPSNATGAPACQKGWLWPFVRESGDCPTDTDKKNAGEK
ncbi:MAG TPA: hypothetical protein VNH44_17590 [Micropepsaceae bacterium]|nr:hypothetical protein [Micropepsaceae bacterium]